MICEHKRESRSTASSSLDPVAAPGTCPESSWLASLPSPSSTRLHWATASVFTTTRSLCALRPSRGRQSVEPLLTSVECLPPHSFTHDSRAVGIPLSLSPSLPLSPSISLPFCCPFFNCICRDFTARCAFDSRTEIPYSLHPTLLPFSA